MSAHQINLFVLSTSPIYSSNKHITVLFIIFWMKVAGLVHCNKLQQDSPKAETARTSVPCSSIIKSTIIIFQRMLAQCCPYRMHCYQSYALSAKLLCGHIWQVLSIFPHSQEERKKDRNIPPRSLLFFPEFSQIRARRYSTLRLRFSWKQNTWCGKHIPLSCPLPYHQDIPYTVIAPRCIVFSKQATLKSCHNVVAYLRHCSFGGDSPFSVIFQRLSSGCATGVPSK